MHRLVVMAVTAIALVMGHVDPTAAKGKERADGTITLSEGSVAVGIGWSWGKGELTYRGKKHPFKVDGLTVQALGATRVDATGYVYGLTRLEDFSGTYAGVAASATAGGGTGVTTMKNGKGVRITLRSTTQGLALKAGPEGIKITLQ